jgi:hypothetical protein
MTGTGAHILRLNRTYGNVNTTNFESAISNVIAYEVA